LTALRCFVDGRLWRAVEPPPTPESMAPRAWILGVVAVQLAVAQGRVTAQARSSRTGDEAEVLPLQAPALVQVALAGPGDDVPLLPRLSPPPLAGAAARVQLFLGDEPAGEMTLAPAALFTTPPPRGFGHVWCRWLREGGIEPGFDLTDFVSIPLGGQFERQVVRTITPGQVVSYAVVF
jgi:hypothetical protein